MSELINVSICVSDIPRDQIKIAKNGKKYIAVCVSQLREPDSYENTHSVFMRQTKEEREAKVPRVFIGRGKAINFSSIPVTAASVVDMPPADRVDDLPF